MPIPDEAPPDTGALVIQPVDDPRHVARLRRILTFLLASLLIFVPLDFVVFFTLGDPRSLIMGALTIGIGALWWWSRRDLDRGRLGRAVFLTTFSFMVPTFAYVIVRPFLYPVLAVAPILAVAVTLPLARGRNLATISVSAAAFVAGIIGVGVFLEARDTNTLPPPLAAAIFSLALAVVLGLVLFALWQFGGRLAAAMAETHTTMTALELSNQQLKRVDDFKTQFMNTAAHEINTPLTPIRLQLHLLRSGGVGSIDDQARDALRIIDRNVERVAVLVRDVLDASRIQGARLQLNPTLVDLRDIVREVHESFLDAARVSGVAVNLEAPQPLPTFADARRLHQVLFNFVGNALKFTPNGGTISIRAELVDAEIRVEVVDTGAGFRPDQESRLFQAFSQLGNAPNVRGGTGLGLFISRGIITEHGGRVGASSPGPGQGSTFWFTLPVKTALIAPPVEPPRLSPSEVRIRELI